MQISNKNTLTFDDCYLSLDDVLLKPSTGVIKSRKEALINTTFLYSSPMDTVYSDKLAQEIFSTGQAALSCRFVEKNKRLLDLFNNYAEENFWFSVGASYEDYHLVNEFIKDLKMPEVKLNISVDVAHGDTLYMQDLYLAYSSAEWCKNLMSGTVATYSSACNVFEAGCTHVRVGIGPGSACSTRIVTGCGVPNLSAIYRIYTHFKLDIEAKILNSMPIIIADGGIRTSGDIAKYLAAGADGVMVGSLLSKTFESGGWKKSSLNSLLFLLTKSETFYKKSFYKRYRGQASKAFQLDHKGKVSGTPEGVEGPVQNPQYTYSELYHLITSGLKSTISYTGLNSLDQLSPETVEFLKITQSGLLESKPHLLY